MLAATMDELTGCRRFNLARRRSCRLPGLGRAGRSPACQDDAGDDRGVRRLLSGETLAIDGARFLGAAPRLSSLPPATGHPIYVGAMGPPPARPRGSADEALPLLLPRALRHRAPAHRGRACARAATRGRSIWRRASGVSVAEDGAAARRALARRWLLRPGARRPHPRAARRHARGFRDHAPPPWRSGISRAPPRWSPTRCCRSASPARRSRGRAAPAARRRRRPPRLAGPAARPRPRPRRRALGRRVLPRLA